MTCWTGRTSRRSRQIVVNPGERRGDGEVEDPWGAEDDDHGLRYEVQEPNQVQHRDALCVCSSTPRYLLELNPLSPALNTELSFDLGEGGQALRVCLTDCGRRHVAPYVACSSRHASPVPQLMVGKSYVMVYLL